MTVLNRPDEITLSCADIALAASGHGDLDAAVALLHRLPAGTAGRDRLAAALIGAFLRDLRLDLPRLRHLDGLLAVAETGPPPIPGWHRLRAGARAVALMCAAAEGRLADPRAGLADLDVLVAEAGDAPELRPLFESARTALTFLTAMTEGDESSIRRLPEQLDLLQASAGAAHPQGGALVELAGAFSALMAANQRDEELSEPLRRVREAIARMPADDPVRAAAAEALAMLTEIAGPQAAGGDPVPFVPGGFVPADDAQRSGPDRALMRTHAAITLLGRGTETDLGKVDEAIAQLREAARLAGPEDAQRPFHLAGLALGLLRRSELTNSVAGLDEAEAMLTEARGIAGGPHHPQWSWLNDMLSWVQRRLGHDSRPYRTALDGLRGHAYRVLVQSDLAAATVAARDAARDAADAARWCLQAGEPADAIAALDAGRGLALFAATELGTVPERLRAAGQDELAGRWSAALASGEQDRLPTGLRREVLTVLTEQGSSVLLDPPGLDEIRGALREVDADALVYLVPGEPGMPGYAVVAPAEGPPSYLTLPGLHPGDDHDVERYLTTAARRDAAVDPSRDMGAAEDEPDPEDAFTGSLDALCRWAWRAAMGPLIDQYLPRLAGRAPGRPPRIVLVPMGELARIPWQAARRADGTYAVQLAAVSQIVSARMLCHAAALSPVPLAPIGLVVGDPDTGDPHRDLPAARSEAYAIRRVFYPGARYVGRRPDGSTSPSGPGRADEVRSWLTASSPAAGSVLHLACHGFLSTDAATAYLLLAGGDRLHAETLGAVLGRVPERAIGLVVLAACRTGLAISGYDEAYSLGTAFLAAGVRSVLSTQWSVPDGATSVLMFMVHHYLMAEGRPVWEALHRAQLWMLDPARRIPDRMPGDLRAELAGADLAAVAAWAGFVHWGR